MFAAAAHGNTQLGMFWMMVVGRGIAGFGAGGEVRRPSDNDDLSLTSTASTRSAEQAALKPATKTLSCVAAAASWWP